MDQLTGLDLLSHKADVPASYRKHCRITHCPCDDSLMRQVSQRGDSWRAMAGFER